MEYLCIFYGIGARHIIQHGGKHAAAAQHTANAGGKSIVAKHSYVIHIIHVPGPEYDLTINDDNINNFINNLYISIIHLIYIYIKIYVSDYKINFNGIYK